MDLSKEVYFECSRKSFKKQNIFTIILHSLMLTMPLFYFYLLVKTGQKIIIFLLSAVESLVDLISLTSVCNSHSNVNIVKFVFDFYIIKCILKDSVLCFLHGQKVT